MTNIGKNITRRRKELNLTQEELAKKMGYKSKSTINKIELGINDIPQSKVVKFAEVLNVSIAYLMGWEEEEKKNDTLSNIVVRLRIDEDFFEVVSLLNEIKPDKLNKVMQMINLIND